MGCRLQDGWCDAVTQRPQRVKTHLLLGNKVGEVRLHMPARRGRRSPVVKALLVKKIALAIAAKCRENVRTNNDGMWTPVQWGPRAGMPALTAWASDWSARFVGSGRWKVLPVRHQKAWRGHVAGMEIHPRKAPYLVFPDGFGRLIRAKSVKLPRRDPRPTQQQIREITAQYMR